MGRRRIRSFEGWIPIRKIAVLTRMHGGAARWCTLLAGRSWSVLLVRRDRTKRAKPAAELPTVAEVVAALSDASLHILRLHEEEHHPGWQCEENDRGQCRDLDRADTTPKEVPDAPHG